MQHEKAGRRASQWGRWERRSRAQRYDAFVCGASEKASAIRQGAAADFGTTSDALFFGTHSLEREELASEMFYLSLRVSNCVLVCHSVDYSTPVERDY